MNKPIITAIVVGFAGPVAELAASYFNDRELPWFIALSVGIYCSLMFYAVTTRNQKKVNSSSEQIPS